MAYAIDDNEVAATVAHAAIIHPSAAISTLAADPAFLTHSSVFLMLLLMLLLLLLLPML